MEQQDIRFRAASTAIYRLDLRGGVLWRDEERVHVPPKEWRALCYLAQKPGELVDTNEIVDAVWGKGAAAPYGGVGKVVGHLRRIFGDTMEKPAFIETVHARGYRFVAEILASFVTPPPGKEC
jgi:DNA-binding winged helix-turn-helix (wHTH) protein